MKDSIQDSKTETTSAVPQKPAWWTDSLETSWHKMKEETIKDWNTLADGEKKVEQSINEDAVALGYGARGVYHDLQLWTRELEDKLKTDWQETGHAAKCAWDEVSAAAKHGWEHAVEVVNKPAEAKPTEAKPTSAGVAASTFSGDS
jgi:hypothetical protein